MKESPLVVQLGTQWLTFLRDGTAARKEERQHPEDGPKVATVCSHTLVLRARTKTQPLLDCSRTRIVGLSISHVAHIFPAIPSVYLKPS